ncbi:MAG: formylglycine-generating enzyme family protein [Lentimicrobiaceae bacterium]|nr:formylglycine-generating enzyme family protein [Lentimicrobiaceae bacterium]
MKKYYFFALLATMMFITQTGHGQENLTFTVNGVTFEMVFVEGGNYLMGCTSGQEDCYPRERPVREISVTDFFMGKYQVTQKLWYSVTGTTISQLWLDNAYSDREFYMKSKAGGQATFDEGVFFAEDYSKVIPLLYGAGDNYPMWFVNYTDCEYFCDELNHLLAKQLPEGYKFCIPAEAEWEYAARGGKLSKGYKYSGSNHINDVAWYIDNSKELTYEVGKKMPNELGIYDMSGNVWEWCGYRFSENDDSRKKSAKFKEPDEKMVLRGGGWNSIEQSCCVSSYHYNSLVSNERASYCGFRLALVKE